jgi:hypothetical protein
MHPGRGGFIRPMQDASAPHDAIGRGCHQRDGLTGPGFWAGNPAPTTLRRSPVPAGDERRRHDARSACLGLSALCFRPSASERASPAQRVHRGRFWAGDPAPTTVRRSSASAGDERRREDARSACRGLSALCFRPSACVSFGCHGVLDPAPRESSVHPGRGGFIRPMQDASAPCDAIGRGCHRRDGFNVLSAFGFPRARAGVEC